MTGAVWWRTSGPSRATKRAASSRGSNGVVAPSCRRTRAAISGTVGAQRGETRTTRTVRVKAADASARSGSSVTAARSGDSTPATQTEAGSGSWRRPARSDRCGSGTITSGAGTATGSAMVVVMVPTREAGERQRWMPELGSQARDGVQKTKTVWAMPAVAVFGIRGRPHTPSAI